MEEKELDIRKLRNIELEMLILFKEICDKNNMRYFLIGGTLLGAIRHHGFIPWDDDIDIGMPRADFEKFIRNAQKELPEGIFVQSRLSEPKLPINFAKIRNSNTTFIESSIKKFNINHGVYIDIFPFDYYPDRKIKQLGYRIKNKIIKARLRGLFTLDDRAKKSPLTEILYKIFFVLSHVIFPTVKSALDAQNRLLQRTMNSTLCGNMLGAWGDREIVPKVWFDDFEKVEFESSYFSAPKEWDKYLTRIYGDYMELPPEEKRVPHHYVELIDLNNPYTMYRNREE